MLLLGLFVISSHLFAQEEVIGLKSSDAIRILRNVDSVYKTTAYHDSVYSDISEKITFLKFMRWNTPGTLTLYLNKYGIVRYFEITFAHFTKKEWASKAYNKDLSDAISELTKKYGKEFFCHLADDISSYAWDTKEGEFNFLIYTKKHNWLFGFYPDTGD